jgi:hypothetical protein
VASLQTHSAVQSLNQAREAKIASGGTFRLTDFLLELVPLARQSIDTPEERTNVVNAVMGFYDEYVSSHVPELFRAQTREFVLSTFTAALNAAAGV